MANMLRTATIIHLAICAGLGIGLAVFYSLVNQSGLPSSSETDPALFVPVAFFLGVSGALGSFILPNLLFAKMVSPADRPAAYEPLAQEQIVAYVQRYQSVKIVQWALVEGAGLFCGLVFFMTAQMQLLFAAVVLLGILMFHRPSREDFKRRLALNDQQLGGV